MAWFEAHGVVLGVGQTWPMPVTIRVLGEDDWPAWRHLRLRALADSPEAFGATLAEWSGDGDTEGRWRDRLRGVPLNLLAADDGHDVGMVGATSTGESEVELVSMWVATEARGQGVADALVDGVVNWARQKGAVRVVLAVRQGNRHAVQCYVRCRFVDTGPVQCGRSGPLARRMVLDLTTG